MEQTYIFDIETAGLNPIEDRITAIAMKNINGESVLSSFTFPSEKVLLETFWSQIRDGDILIGYCSDNFDFPFILKRSLIHNVKIKKIKTKDLKKIVDSFFTSYNKYEKGKLSDWAKVLGIEVLTENGSRMIDLWNKGNTDEILEHCKEDVEITEALYKRCADCGFLE